MLTVERQIEVSQQAEQRELRADAYLALVDAADDYANRTNDVLKAHDLRGTLPPDAIDVLRSDQFVSRWLDSRNTFQDALNRVYVYGSAEGWQAARGLAGALPYARGEEYEWVEVAPTMSDRYTDVLKLVCGEATVTPRADCNMD
ncbi:MULTISPECIES: hypothetical protein [unclassified Microbacterium]|uniref:hypothetical protein n=1 Tax=unclassified Microbacterium TaxID=2609290 RepID=UPI00109BBC82|nr:MULTISPECIES: hypothetical protein [unclassified Microbacterium]